jgi:hypothetical protein
MDEKRNYVLDMIIKNLDDVNENLEKLSTFTKDEVSHIRIELTNLIQEVKQLKERPCPRNPEALRDCIETERLKYQSKQPKKFMEIVGWVVAVAAGVLTLYYMLKTGAKV